jgi:hypothetical protein
MSNLIRIRQGGLLIETCCDRHGQACVHLNFQQGTHRHVECTLNVQRTEGILPATAPPTLSDVTPSSDRTVVDKNVAPRLAIYERRLLLIAAAHSITLSVLFLGG